MENNFVVEVICAWVRVEASRETIELFFGELLAHGELPEEGVIGNVAASVLLDCRKVANVVMLMRGSTNVLHSDINTWNDAVKIEEAAYATSEPTF